MILKINNSKSINFISFILVILICTIFKSNGAFIGDFNYQLIDNDPQYGTPNCSVRIAVSFLNFESLEIESNYDYQRQNLYVSADNRNMVARLDFSVIPNGKPIIVTYYTFLLINQSFQCVPEPIQIQSLTALKAPYFQDRRLSYSSFLPIQFNISHNYPLSCTTIDCFGCSVVQSLPYSSGYYNISVWPDFTCSPANLVIKVKLVNSKNIEVYSLDFQNLYKVSSSSSYLSSSFKGTNYNGLYTGNSINSQIIIAFNSIETDKMDFIQINDPNIVKQKYGSIPRLLSTQNIGYNMSIYYHSIESDQSAQFFGDIVYLKADDKFNKYSNPIVKIVNYQFKPYLVINSLAITYINGNIFSRSSFNLPQSNTLGINYNSKIHKFEYPLGYGSGTLMKYNHIYDFPYPIYNEILQVLPIYQLQKLPTSSFLNQWIVSDSTPPQLTSFEIVPISLYSFRYTAHATDDFSGIYSITIIEDVDPRSQGKVVLLAQDLVYGNDQSICNGTFSKIVTTDGYNHDRSYSILVQDTAGNVNTYNSENYIPFTDKYIPPFPKQVSWNENNFTFDVQYNSEKSIILRFNFTNDYTHGMLKPMISMNLYYDEASKHHKLMIAKYYESFKCYGIDLIIPNNYSSFKNGVNFVVHGDRDISSGYLYSRDGYKLVLDSVYQDYTVFSPPIINDMVSNVNRDNVKFQVFVSNIAFSYVNPNTKGYFVIQGEYDPIPKRIEIPYIVKGMAESSLDFPNYNKCRTQSYKIIGGYLDDGNMTTSSFDPSLLDPILGINLKPFTFICTTQDPDDSPPKLNYFYSEPSATTLYANESTSFKVFAKISDDIGLKDQPTLYVTTLNDHQMRVKGESLCDSRMLSCLYVFNVTIERYWGDGNLFLSLYGLLDQYDNIQGYSTLDLAQYNNSVINRIYPGRPMITVTPTPTQTTPCTNKCSGNGICIGNNQCNCYNGFYGPNCEGTVLSIPKPLPNPGEPTVISEPNSNVNLDIQFSELLELDSNRLITERYSLQNKKWKMESSSDNNTFTYSTKINNETTLYIIIDLTTDERTIEFAGLNITIPPHSIKYTMKLDQYSFKSQLNILQLRMSTAFKSSENLCSSSIDTSSNTKDLEYIKIQYNGKILFGRFIQRSLVDGIPQVATTELIQSTESNGTSFIGINIPNYSNQVILDPNFSVLVTDDFDKCKSSKLSKGALIGIVVGCVAFASVVILLSVILFSSSKRQRLLIAFKSLVTKKDNTITVEMN